MQAGGFSTRLTKHPIPDHVTTSLWIALGAAWLLSASVLIRMKIRARRLDERSSWMRDTPAARRATMASSTFSTVCAASVSVPILSKAPAPVIVFWLLAIPPVIYAGIWLTLGVVGVMWLTGWRPRRRR